MQLQRANSEPVNPRYRERGSPAKKEAFTMIRDPQEQTACLVTQEVFVQRRDEYLTRTLVVE